MIPSEYLKKLTETIGYYSLEEARATLKKPELIEQLKEAYQSDNGTDGSILWTEILDLI